MTPQPTAGRGQLHPPAPAAPNPICVALDFDDPERVRSVAAATSDYAGVFKIGLTTYASGGHSLTVLAVTILTSLDDHALDAMGMKGPSRDAVLRLAGLALTAGADGLVCSPHEVAALRSEFGARRGGGPLLVVPGIRAAGEAQGDQRRTLSAAEALAAGADLIVVGRPITAAPDPAAAARALLAEVGR